MNVEPYVKSERYFRSGGSARRLRRTAGIDLSEFVGGEQRRNRRLASQPINEVIGWRIRWYGGDATGGRTITLAQWGEVPT